MTIGKNNTLLRMTVSDLNKRTHAHTYMYISMNLHAIQVILYAI